MIGQKPAPVRPEPQALSGQRLWRRILSRENTLLVVLVAFALLVTLLQPRFLNWENVILILAAATILGVVALGEFLVIVSGAIDISIGAILAVGTAVTALSLQADIPTLVAVALGLLAAALAGSVNGVLVAVAGLPSVVVTLATLSLLRGGLALLFSGTPLHGGQESLGWLWRPLVAGIPPSVMLFFVVAVLTAAFVRWTQLGRDIFSVGSNQAAARIAGVGVRRVQILTFTIAGLLAGVAGVLVVGQQAMIQLGQVGVSFEFLAIGAVVLGGTDIFGGSGRVRGAMVGVILLYSVYNAMVVAAIPPAWQSAVVGVLILTAVVIDAQRGRIP